MPDFFVGKFQRLISLINHTTLGVLAAFSAKISGAGLSFLFSVMLARYLGAAGTGVYFLALTIITIGATIARLGLDNAVLRFAAVAFDKTDYTTLAALYRRSIGLVVAAGVVISLLIWLVVPWLSLGGDQSAELQSILPVILIALVPTALLSIQGTFFKAIGVPGVATFTQSSLLPLLLVVGGVLFTFSDHTGVGDIVVLYVVASMVSVLFAGAYWNWRKLCPLFAPGFFDLRLLLGTSLPLLWVTSINMVMSWTDIMVLGIWSSSSVVGVYAVATRTAALTALVLTAVNSVTAPRFAVLYAKGEEEGLECLAQQSAGWMLLVASPVILVLFLFPVQVLTLFGADFVGGANLLRILALGQLVNVAMGSVGYLLMMTGHERLMRNTIAIAAVLNLGGNLVLVPTWGGTGAAVSTALSLAFVNVTAFFLVCKKLNINTLGYLLRMCSDS